MNKIYKTKLCNNRLFLILFKTDLLLHLKNIFNDVSLYDISFKYKKYSFEVYYKQVNIISIDIDDGDVDCLNDKLKIWTIDYFNNRNRIEKLKKILKDD